MSTLAKLDEEALLLKNAGRNEEAAEIYTQIVQQQPDWEHGQSLHNLAQCYEDLGRLELAEKFYKRALNMQPAYDIFLGGYASFLYLHGDPLNAFDWYMRLLSSERMQRFDEGAESCILALRTLGEKLGWNPDVVNEKIAEAVERIQ